MLNTTFNQLVEGKFLQFGQAIVNVDNKKEIAWEYVARKGNREAVVIVPYIEPCDEHPDGAYVLVMQYRPPIGAYVVEFPAGLRDKDESVYDTAVRELEEETGYVVKNTDVPVKTASSPGITNEIVWLVNAIVHPQLLREPKREETEVLLGLRSGTVSARCTIFNLQKYVGSGTVIDAKVAAQFMRNR